MNLGLGLLSKGRNNCDSAVNCQNDMDNGSSTFCKCFYTFYTTTWEISAI